MNIKEMHVLLPTHDQARALLRTLNADVVLQAGEDGIHGKTCLPVNSSTMASDGRNSSLLCRTWVLSVGREYFD